MGKVNEMATLDERIELAEKLSTLKKKFELSYSEMAIKLGSPCKASTLQIRTNKPRVNCSSKLYQRILDGTSVLDQQRTKKEDFEKLKKDFILEMTELSNKYFRKLESFSFN